MPEIRIAPRALAHRLTDFTLNVSGVAEPLVVPREAFSVDTAEIKDVDDTPVSESIVEDSLMLRIKILIGNAISVKFDSMSVLAPRVLVEVKQTETLVIETNALKALSYSLDSALKVSLTQSTIMGTHAAAVRRLWVTNTSRLLLREDSIEMTVPGGEVVLSRIGNVMLSERSIIVGGGARLEFSNVSLTPLGHRAVLSTSPLSLSSMTNVIVSSPGPTPICLATRNLVLKNMTAVMNEHNTAAACFKFSHTLEKDRRESMPVVVLMRSPGIFTDPNLFSDPKCTLCNSQPTGKSKSLPSHCYENFGHYLILFFYNSIDQVL